MTLHVLGPTLRNRSCTHVVLVKLVVSEGLFARKNVGTHQQYILLMDGMEVTTRFLVLGCSFSHFSRYLPEHVPADSSDPSAEHTLAIFVELSYLAQMDTCLAYLVQFGVGVTYSTRVMQLSFADSLFVLKILPLFVFEIQGRKKRRVP